MPRSRDLDFLGHIARESTRFREAIAEAASDAPVQSCPDWNADDLLWHLGEVQWFWGSIVARGVTSNAGVEEVEVLKPERPATRAGLLEFFDSASAQLSKVLTAAQPDTRVWTWADDDQTAGFIRRRQAHEALIHRVDAELSAGRRTAIYPVLGADGVDEALRIMYGGDIPAWGSFTASDDRTLMVTATDTADSWLVTMGRFSGTDPADGKAYDQPGMLVADAAPGASAAAAIEGCAADLDCWLWHRPTIAAIGRSGSPAVLEDIDSLVAAGIS
jgi:uncharacterized protein (TIGR03083 family)